MIDIDYMAEALKKIEAELDKAGKYLVEARERETLSGVWTSEDERRFGEWLGLNSASVIVRTLLEEMRK